MSGPSPTYVTIPYKPRALQLEIHQLVKTHRFGVLVCHRRWGKTVLAVNHLVRGTMTCPLERPRHGYIAPTYTQGKATSFDYFQHYTTTIPDRVVNKSELRVDFPNGGQVRIYGGDNPDSLRGLYFDGVVLDEFGLHPAKTFSEVIGPTLVDRGGSALFLGTPNGKNQFYEMAQHAKAREAVGDPDWFFREFKASQTGLLDEHYLASAKSVMTADEFAQEFECSFEASVKGAIYASELEQARVSHRVGRVPYDPVLPVDTTWDLGFGGQGDSTAIWYTQTLRNHEIRLIDYTEGQGEGLPYYARILQTKPYVYGTHYAPHDIIVKESTGKTRIETAAALGIKFQIVPNVGIEDGIHAVRMLFTLCWFDEVLCRQGLECLMNYRRDYNQKLGEFKATPVHNWASHGADAFRYLAVRQKQASAPASDLYAGHMPTGENAWMGL